MATFVRTAWENFCNELQCVDDEYLNRAFKIVWNLRGEFERSATDDPKRIAAIKRRDIECEDEYR